MLYDTFHNVNKKGYKRAVPIKAFFPKQITPCRVRVVYVCDDPKKIIDTLIIFPKEEGLLFYKLN